MPVTMFQPPNDLLEQSKILSNFLYVKLRHKEPE